MSADLRPLTDAPGMGDAGTDPRIAPPHPGDSRTRSPGTGRPSAGSSFGLGIGRAMGVVVVTAHGDLGPSEADVLRAVLVDLIEGQGNLKVVLDVRDVSGLDRSVLEILVAATDAAAQLGGQLTFADPTEAGLQALEAIGLGDAVTLARQSGRRVIAPRAPGQGNGAARRAKMAEHPAGTGRDREHAGSFFPQR